MNNTSCTMIRKQNVSAVIDGPPGSFCFVTHPDGTRSMCLQLPDGMASIIDIRPCNPGGPSWEWDGNEEQPTLSPSVHAIDRWHGWVRNGRMESC